MHKNIGETLCNVFFSKPLDTLRNVWYNIDTTKGNIPKTERKNENEETGKSRRLPQGRRDYSIEQHPMWGEFIHKFEIVRNNPKTFGCKYIEGAHTGSGFNWIKGYDLTQAKNREYYI